MDLALYLRVLWRFRIIVAVGFMMAVLLSFFAVEKVSFSGGSLKLTSRKTETWKSDAFLQITGQGFPVGRAVPAYTSGDTKTGKPSIDPSDPGRLSYLTTVYANLATNDTIVRRVGIDPTKPAAGAFTVTAVAGPAYSNPAILNILDFTATGPTAARAVGLANATAGAFQNWLRRNQETNGIDPGTRTLAQEYKSATPAVLISHTGKTLPVIVFLTVLGATMGLALVLENVRPRPGRAIEPELHVEPTERQHAEPERQQAVHEGRRRRRSSSGRPRR